MRLLLLHAAICFTLGSIHSGVSAQKNLVVVSAGYSLSIWESHYTSGITSYGQWYSCFYQDEAFYLLRSYWLSGSIQGTWYVGDLKYTFHEPNLKPNGKRMLNFSSEFEHVSTINLFAKSPKFKGRNRITCLGPSIHISAFNRRYDREGMGSQYDQRPTFLFIGPGITLRHRFLSFTCSRKYTNKGTSSHGCQKPISTRLNEFSLGIQIPVNIRRSTPSDME